MCLITVHDYDYFAGHLLKVRSLHVLVRVKVGLLSREIVEMVDSRKLLPNFDFIHLKP